MRKRYPGQGVHVTFQVNDPDTGQPFDPATVAITVGSADPAGTHTTHTHPNAAIENISPGVYRVEVVPDDAGLWGARIVTTDPAGHGALDVYFAVEESLLDSA